ncbi:MAG: AAA family ATPase [Bacteroidetes bacterium]|nr:AAA family ATPase [Bacteroidota bacterium]MBL0097804.1 AAA family ATPase [Bacteroidota bacterium]
MKFIEQIELKGYKGLDGLTVSNIGQFNVILGDNNVGKTSLLESILFTSEEVENIGGFLDGAIGWRFSSAKMQASFHETDLLDYYFDFNSSRDVITINFKERGGDTQVANFEKRNVDVMSMDEIEKFKLKLPAYFREKTSLSSNEVFKLSTRKKEVYFKSQLQFMRFAGYLPFIPMRGSYDDDLVGYFSNLVGIDYQYKLQLIEVLKRGLGEPISDIIISTTIIKGYPIICIVLEGNNSPIPISIFGDGMLKLFRYLLEVLSCKDKFLLIDEVDNGFYYKKYDLMFEVLIKAAFEHRVQLFMTTHSLECINAFEKVVSNNENYKNDARVINLFRGVDKAVKSVTYTFNEFSTMLSEGNEVR